MQPPIVREIQNPPGDTKHLGYLALMAGGERYFVEVRKRTACNEYIRARVYPVPHLTYMATDVPEPDLLLTKTDVVTRILGECHT